MQPPGVVTLLTDFGTTDPFVGVMKGVILTRFPAARIVDLTHGIPPQDVAAAAFWLERSYLWFPPGTVHCVVVDPGVGSARAAIAARAGDHVFVAPDNGVLGGVELDDVRVVDLAALGVPAPSRTFHGRDVFAPAAADLASGRLDLAGIGAVSTGIVRAPRPRAARGGDTVTGHVVVVDHFGNLITDIEPALFANMRDPRVHVADRELRVVATYAEAAPGALVALVNSFGTLEIARRDGSATAALGIGAGAQVRVRRE